MNSRLHPEPLPLLEVRSSSKLPSKEEGHTHRSKKKGAKARVNTSHLDVNTQLLEAIEQEKPRAHVLSVCCTYRAPPPF